MKPYLLILSLLAIGVPTAPAMPLNTSLSALAPSPELSAIIKKKTKRKLSKTQKGKQVPEQPSDSTAESLAAAATSPTSADSSPSAHKKSYQDFLSRLNEKAKAGDLDISEALAVMLAATGDEFSQAQWLEQAAKDGNPIGMHYLGMTKAAQNAAPELRYLRGNERAELLKKQQEGAADAIKWLKKAAELKYTPAMLDYSVFLRMGIGTQKNENAAKRMMLEAAKSGNFDTRFSWLLQNQRLTCWEDKDRPEVAGEINRNNHQVIYYLSQFAPDSSTQLEWLTRAATQNGAAMFALSSISHKNDPALSLKLLKTAVALHDPGAMFVYGSLLVAPPGEFNAKTGLQQNTALGVNMIRLACMQGNSAARRALSRAYYRGDFGLKQDKQKAYKHIKWLNSAQKDHIALAAQGFMLLIGEGTQQDIETGKRYISLAANDGYSYALVMMAYAHYKGLGTQKNPEQAIELLQEAAATGFPHAYIYIAFLSAKGLHGQEPDLRNAERYVNIAGLNLGNQAKVFFDSLMQQSDWTISPFPLEKQ